MVAAELIDDEEGGQGSIPRPALTLPVAFDLPFLAMRCPANSADLGFCQPTPTDEQHPDGPGLYDIPGDRTRPGGEIGHGRVKIYYPDEELVRKAFCAPAGG